MQNVTAGFNNKARGYMRKINWAVSIAFTKTFEASVEFFTIGESLIGGNDLLRPANGDVVQEWDKYNFVDYSGRVIGISWERQFEDISSANSAIADVTFDNSDNFFTPGAGSLIDGYILPSRPIRIQAGFGNELVPVFIGITEKMPIIDEKAKTATFHCIDFMSVLFDREISETSLFENMATHEILEDLFFNVGVLPSQLELDAGTVTVPFVYFSRGEKLRDAVLKLAQVEQGKVFMDELGKIRFKNKSNTSISPVYSFNYDRDILDFGLRKEDNLINSVNVSGKVRAVSAFGSIWGSGESYEIGPDSSVVIWASFSDPVKSVDTPEYEGVEGTFSVNTASDGSGSAEASDVTLTGFEVFSSAVKMTFTNSDLSNTYYIMGIELFGELAEVINDVSVQIEDTDSITNFGEKNVSIVNDFFQSSVTAENFASEIISQYSVYGDVVELNVKGNMALQLDDVVFVKMNTGAKNYRVSKLINKIENPARYTQIIKLRSL